MNKKRIAVIGSGSWGTALVKILSLHNLHSVYWWVRHDEDAEHIRLYGNNPRYLSSVSFAQHVVKVSTDLAHCIHESEVVVLAVPAAFLSATLAGLSNKEMQNRIFISAIKGMIPGNHLLPAEFLQREFGVHEDHTAVISGPCHAEEVALEKLSYLTIASSNKSLSDSLCEIFRCRFIRTISSTDERGTEYAAVMKNIYALAAGIYHGLGYGDNFLAVFLTNSIREMEFFLQRVCPGYQDVKQSAYLGDLLVTAYSQFSRNRTFGTMIGKGYSVKSAQLEMNMVAEGYYAVNSIYHIAATLNINLPIVEAVYRVLYERISPVMEMRLLTEKLS